MLFGPDLSRFVREGNTRGLFKGKTVVSLLTGEPEYMDPLKDETPEGWIVTGYPWNKIDTPAHKRFVAAYRAENGYDPGQYVAGTYLYGEVLYAALEALKGKVEDKQAFIKALRGVRAETLRGPIAFDEYGNVIGNIHIRKVQKKDGRLVNTNIYTYSNVSQFWTYDPKEFLKQPVYSRDWPPMKA